MSKLATREAFGQELSKLIVENKSIVVLTADVAGSVKTDLAAKVCPERCFDIGIAEENMMSIAAGLAATGKCVFAATYAVFATGRAFEQIRQSIAYPHLNVKVCGSHTGIAVGPDGASHQAVVDMALMRALPGMVVIQPADDLETRQAVAWAADYNGPVYLRLGRGSVEDVNDLDYQFNINKATVLKEGKDIAICATGCEVQEALKATEVLKPLGYSPTVINFSTIKPIDKNTVIEMIEHNSLIYTVEDHEITGGLGSAIAEVMAENPSSCKLIRIGLNDTFGESGKTSELQDKYGLSANKIAELIAKNGI